MLGKLKSITSSELELMRSWRNAPAVRKNMYTTHEISLEEHLSWWNRIQGRKDCEYFMYYLDGSPEGVVGFTQIDTTNRHAFWAFYAGPEASKGVGGRMEYLALEHAFSILNLNKLNCEVLSFNLAVIKLHQKFGFSEEGVFHSHHRVDGGWANVHRLAIFSDDWAARRDEMYLKLSSFSRN